MNLKKLDLLYCSCKTNLYLLCAVAFQHVVADVRLKHSVSLLTGK